DVIDSMKEASGRGDVSTVPAPVVFSRLGIACRHSARNCVDLIGCLSHKVLNPVVENVGFLGKSAEKFTHKSGIRLEEKIPETLLEDGSAHVPSLDCCHITEGQHSAKSVADSSMQFTTGVRYPLRGGIE